MEPPCGFFRHSALFNRLRALYIGDSKQEKRDIAWQNGWNQGATGAPRVPIDEYAENLTALVALAESLDAQVLFVGLAKQTEVDGAYDGLAIQYRAVLQETAALADAPYIDALRVWRSPVCRAKNYLWISCTHPPRDITCSDWLFPKQWTIHRQWIDSRVATHETPGASNGTNPVLVEDP